MAKKKNRFAHMAQPVVTGEDTRSVIMEGFAGKGQPNPVLHLRPTWNINADYTAARLKLASVEDLTKMAQEGTELTTDLAKLLRDEDRELFPATVISSWENMPDGDGGFEEFSVEAAQDFVAILSDQVFDQLRGFCGNPRNWGLTQRILPGNLEKLLGNSD